MSFTCRTFVFRVIFPGVGCWSSALVWLNLWIRLSTVITGIRPIGVNLNQLPKTLKPTYIAWLLGKLKLRSSVTDPKLLIQSTRYNKQIFVFAAHFYQLDGCSPSHYVSCDFSITVCVTNITEDLPASCNMNFILTSTHATDYTPQAFYTHGNYTVTGCVVFISKLVVPTLVIGCTGSADESMKVMLDMWEQVNQN